MDRPPRLHTDRKPAGRLSAGIGARYSDAVANAKRDLKAGEILVRGGDSAVWGKLIPAEDPLKIGGLPIGLAYHTKLKRAISKAKHIGWPDIKIDETSEACRIQHKIKDTFALSNTSPNDNH